MQDQHIVHISHIVLGLQRMLGELVELVQVDVRTELTEQVADWHPYPLNAPFLVLVVTKLDTEKVRLTRDDRMNQT